MLTPVVVTGSTNETVAVPEVELTNVVLEVVNVTNVTGPLPLLIYIENGLMYPEDSGVAGAPYGTKPLNVSDTVELGVYDEARVAVAWEIAR